MIKRYEDLFSKRPPLDGRFVKHFGIKGMKWGVINDKTRASADPNSSQAKGKALTDKELKDSVNRMELERRYTELTQKLNDQDRGILDEGLAFSNYVMTNVGKQVVDQFVQKGASEIVKTVIEYHNG